MMSSNINDLSDDERLLDLLRLIVTRHPGAKAAINDAFKRAPHLANSYLSFNFRESGSRSEHECRCHYEHEYMTYITETGFDFESFSRVAKNVLQGHCRHTQFSASPTREIATLTSRKSDLNLRRHSVDFDLTNNNKQHEKRLVTRRSSSSLRSLELNENNRGLTGLRSRRSSSNLRSLAIEAEEIRGLTQTCLLHAAAAVGDGGLFMFLLKRAKQSLEQVGTFQLSALHIAIIKHKMVYLRNIILRPETYLCSRSGVFRHATISPDKHGHKGRLTSDKLSLLGLCVRLDDIETMQDLLNTGLMSDVALERGLSEAVDADSVDAVEILLQCGARPDIDIMKAGTSKSLAVFESIFHRFRKDFKIYSIQHPDYITRELIMPSILTRNYAVLQLLLQNGAPISSKGFYTPLTCAVLENQPEIVDLLLEYHAEKSAELQGYNLVDISACMGFTGCTDCLRKFGMKRKNRSIKSSVPCSLLLGIAGKLDLPLDQVKLHRELESKHHRQDQDTVLHTAIKTKMSQRLVREILKTGSNINARNKKLETPLMCAVSKEVCADPEIIRELLYFNPILELCDKSGKTTLAMAIGRDYVQRSLNTKYGTLVEPPESVGNLLLDCGYNVKFDDVKKPHHTMYALKTVWKDLAATIGCGREGLYQHNPKSLGARSREIIRRSYPGIRLHKFLEFMKVAPEITDYVLMVELLKIDPDD